MKGLYFIVEPEALEVLIAGIEGLDSMRAVRSAARNLPAGSYRIMKVTTTVIEVEAAVRTTVMIHGQSLVPAASKYKGEGGSPAGRPQED